VSYALTVSYLLHVLSGAFWTGAALYVAYAVFPAARAGDLRAPAFERSVDGLLRVTRWTGLVLPATGLYQIWILYPLDALFGTTRGHLVLAMFALWGVMNGLLEVGIYRMQTAAGPAPGFGTYMAEGFSIGTDDGGTGGSGSDAEADRSGLAVEVPRLAAVGRPYVLASAGLAVLLLVDAALLAGGVPV
jgi:uncharacterized membrane protein